VTCMLEKNYKKIETRKLIWLLDNYLNDQIAENKLYDIF